MHCKFHTVCSHHHFTVMFCCTKVVFSNIMLCFMPFEFCVFIQICVHHSHAFFVFCFLSVCHFIFSVNCYCGFKPLPSQIIYLDLSSYHLAKCYHSYLEIPTQNHLHLYLFALLSFDTLKLLMILSIPLRSISFLFFSRIFPVYSRIFFSQLMLKIFFTSWKKNAILISFAPKLID